MSLEAAYNAAGPRIVGYLVATGTDEATARDLLHDAVVRVEKRLEGDAAKSVGRDAEGIAALLFATARNLRANRTRDDARIDFVADVVDDAGGAVGSASPAEAVPSDALYVRRRISAALRELPDALREAYVLYQVGGRSVREVAEMTGASESLVKVRIHRAKNSLRKSLADWKEK